MVARSEPANQDSGGLLCGRPGRKHARDCLKVLDANWYKSIFPATRIARGRGARLDFETTRGGGRFSTSVGGTLTGRGGDIIILDDPHKPEDAGSDVRRETVLDWYRSTLLSRLNDPSSGAIILIQQRIHEQDLAGFLIDQGGWEHLDLPAVAEEPCLIDLGWRGKIARNEGDLLHPDRLPRELLDRRRAELGSYIFAAQYQQHPAPIDGGIIDWSWFKSFATPPERQPDDRVVSSWDTASTASEASDYSVCTTWLVRGQYAWMLDLVRARLEFPELQRRIISEAQKWRANSVLIEKAGSGISLIQDINRAQPGLNAIGITPRDDKATRLMSVSAIVEAGRISLPSEAPWIADFRRELTFFPHGSYDDQVDSLSQFLGWFDQPVFQWYVGGTAIDAV